MGLLRAGVGALAGVLSDQWREYFYCEAMPADVLVTKGVKRSSGRSTNVSGSENIITNGSIVAVNEGQCMMIVDQGAIVEFCAEAGEFVWDASAEPSIFYGGFGQGIKSSWEELKKRFTFGGEPAKDQRVYFFNTKEITGNKYGTTNPVPFRVVDTNIGLDMDIGIRCYGMYSYKIADPMLFYKNVCGNISTDFRREEIDSQLKSELLTAMQPAFARISELGVRYSALPGHTTEMAEALDKELSGKWGELRGIRIVSFAVNSVSANEEDEAMIRELQRNAVFRNPNMAAAHLVGAQAEAMQSAAENPNAGPAMAFMGMNMAQQAGGANAGNLFAMGGQQQTADSWICGCGKSNTGNFCAGCGKPKPLGNAPAADSWTCECGSVNTGKFCPACGKGKPEDMSWTCECGSVNTGKFCPNCGKAKPFAPGKYRCNRCGWEPADPTNPPKFCPECGDKFDEGDRV